MLNLLKTKTVGNTIYSLERTGEGEWTVFDAPKFKLGGRAKLQSFSDNNEAFDFFENI